MKTLLLLLFHSSRQISDCMGSVCKFTLRLSIDVLGLTVGFGWGTKQESETCPEAALALCWLYASSHYYAET